MEGLPIQAVIAGLCGRLTINQAYDMVFHAEWLSHINFSALVLFYKFILIK